MSVTIGNKRLSSNEYAYLLGLGLSGKEDKAAKFIGSRKSEEPPFSEYDYNKFTQERNHYMSVIPTMIQPEETKDAGKFIVRDIEAGSPGIRHGTKVNKKVLEYLSIAAAKEDVPLIDVLSVAMRETGIGHWQMRGQVQAQDQPVFTEYVMQSHNSDKGKTLPLDLERFSKAHGLSFVGGDHYFDNITARKKYLNYLKSFKYDESLMEPFRKEVRFLKENPGQKYNPGEKDRLAKIEREKMVIMNNPDLWNYANGIYNSIKKPTPLAEVSPSINQTPIVQQKAQGSYTPSGDGRWTYYSGADTWVNNVTRQTMLPDEYEKKFPNQLRQSGYRTSYK